MDAGRRRETPECEVMDLFTQGAANSISFMFASVHLHPQSHEDDVKGPSRCHTCGRGPRAQLRNPKLREPESLIVDRKAV